MQAIRLSAIGIGLAIGLLIGTANASSACHQQDFDSASYVVCEVHVGDDLRLFLNGSDGEPLATFARLKDTVALQGKRVDFAMNAGMYHPDRSPAGLYVEDGVEQSHIVTSDGPGNFGLLPNGVFCVGDGALSVIESRAFVKTAPKCRFATQSGPMLVIHGVLHPRFLATSDSRYVRNGVGVAADGQTAWFAISDAPVTFHAFARLFRDALKTPNALFLDGSISRLYAPNLGRDDFGFPMGPMVAHVVSADASGG